MIKKIGHPVPLLSYTSLQEVKRMNHSLSQELLTISKDIVISAKVFNDENFSVSSLHRINPA